MRNLTKAQLFLLASILFTITASLSSPTTHSPVHLLRLLGATALLLLSIYFFRKSRSKTKRTDTIRYIIAIYLFQNIYLLSHFYMLL